MVNWGVGWAHPTDGLAGNNGQDRTSPKASIEQCISAGFRVINVGPGNHTISNLSEETSLIFHPGAHNLLNAPVTSDYPAVLRGLHPVPNSISPVGAAYITSPSSVSSYFQWGQYSLKDYPRGGVIENLFFHMDRPTKGAIDTYNCNYMLISDNVFFKTPNTWTNTPGIYNYTQYNPQLTWDGDASWSRYLRNKTFGSPLIHMVGDHPGNREQVAFNVCGGNGTNAQTYYINVSRRTQGLCIHNNSFQDVGSGAVAAVRVGTKPSSCQVYGNQFANINSPNNIAILLDNIASGLVIHSRGAVATDGEVRLIGIDGTQDKTYNGEYNTTDGQKNRIIVMDRYNPA